MAEKTEYRLTFIKDINVETADYLCSRIAQILEQPDFGRLVIQFASEGGSTDSSIAIYNFIHSLPVEVQIHAIGHIGSTGLIAFLAGHTSSPVSRFFLHEYHWTFGESQTLNRIDEAVQRLRSDMQLAREIIEGETNIPADVLDVIDGGTAASSKGSVVITPGDAVKYGLVGGVLELSDTGRDGMKIAVVV